MTAEKDSIKFAQERHLGTIYIPRKGKSSGKFVDAMVSNLGSIFNQEPEVMRVTHKKTPSTWNLDNGLGRNPVSVLDEVRYARSAMVSPQHAMPPKKKPSA
jgi:hypothetical protein